MDKNNAENRTSSPPLSKYRKKIIERNKTSVNVINNKFVNTREYVNGNLIFEYLDSSIRNIERENEIYELSVKYRYFEKACSELGCIIVIKEKTQIRIPSKISVKQLLSILPNFQSLIRPSARIYLHDKLQFNGVSITTNKRGKFLSIEINELTRIEKIIEKLIGQIGYKRLLSFFEKMPELHVWDGYCIVPKELSAKDIDLLVSINNSTFEKDKISSQSKNSEYIGEEKNIDDLNIDRKISKEKVSLAREKVVNRNVVHPYNNLPNKNETEAVSANEVENLRNIPPLELVKRSREYDSYDNEVKARAVFEYLFNSVTHRAIDEIIIGLDPKESRGYQAMGILHHIGLKKIHKGIFSDTSLDLAIGILKQQESDFSIVIQYLEILQNQTLEEDTLGSTILEDIEAELSEEDIYYTDGNVIEYYGKRYERKPENRKKAIQVHGLNCAVCGFDFEGFYGKWGKDFIEVHHLKPLSLVKTEVVINPTEDLAPVCSNCHRMLHRKKNSVLSISELKEMILKQKVTLS